MHDRTCAAMCGAPCQSPIVAYPLWTTNLASEASSFVSGRAVPVDGRSSTNRT